MRGRRRGDRARRAPLERRSLIRIVSQFDRPTARTAVATPTCCCAGCSCCCCCVVTAISSSIYTTVNAHRTFVRNAREAPERVTSMFLLPGLLAFLSIPLAGLAFSALASTSPAGAILFGIAVWFGLITFAYYVAGSEAPWQRAALIVGLSVTAGGLEFFLWLAAASSGS